MTRQSSAREPASAASETQADEKEGRGAVPLYAKERPRLAGVTLDSDVDGMAVLAMTHKRSMRMAPGSARLR